MHNRERGAAHINIYFFLVVLVLFLGSLWFGYVQMSEVNGAKESQRKAIYDLQLAKRDLEHYGHYVEELSDILGEKGKWEGKAGFKWGEKYELLSKNGDEKPRALAGVTVPADIKTLLQASAKGIGLPESEALPVKNFVTHVKSTHDTLVAASATSANNVVAANKQTETIKTNWESDKNKAAKDLTTANANFTRISNELRSENTAKDQRLTNSQGELRKATEDRTKLIEEHNVALAAAQKRYDRVNGHNSALIATLAMKTPPEKSDGELIAATMVADRAWVNIGRKDMLLRGTVFRITAPDGKTLKGYGEVIDTKHDRSELRTYGIVDRVGNPLASGDKIFNDLYSPSLKRHIAMIGRYTHPYNKPLVKTLLERLGNKVHDKVEPGVDLVIVGLPSTNEAGDGLVPIEETPGYKAAQELRCEITTIHKIRDLLQLGN